MNKRVLSVIAGLVVLVSVAAGCSSDKTISASDAEAKLRSTQESKVGDFKLGKASCPDGIEVEDGKTFTCTLEIGDVKAPYTVTLSKTDTDHPRYRFKPTKAIIPVASVEGFLQEQLNDSADGVQIDCSQGPKEIILADVGDRITCKLALGDQRDTATVQVKDTSANFKLLPNQ
jgi:hypothetical protein